VLYVVISKRRATKNTGTKDVSSAHSAGVSQLTSEAGLINRFVFVLIDGLILAVPTVRFDLDSNSTRDSLNGHTGHTYRSYCLSVDTGTHSPQRQHYYYICSSMIPYSTYVCTCFLRLVPSNSKSKPNLSVSRDRRSSVVREEGR
jgi:hypothetical protein